MAENIIFYGPPGTGKTYFLQSKMSEYIDYDVTDKQLTDAYVAETKAWILITLIMLQNHGKMKALEIQEKISTLGIPSINVVSELEDHSMDVSMLGVARKQPCIFFSCRGGYWYVDRVRVQQAKPDFFESFLKDSTVDCRYAFVTFHQSFTYEDFIEGIRPEYVATTNSIDYSPKDGIFKNICSQAEDHPEKQYAVFIDEINRGNISEIFGELISLIEVDKRKGMANELSTTLPYSKKTFVVPSNVNIFGTMNSADRSVGAIDIALRRRFKFIPMVPAADIIEKEMRMNGIDPENIDGINLLKMFNTMNSRIELLLDRNHTLGQALFLGVRSANDIVEVIREKVVPLLEEYFFNDLQKVQMVFNDLDESGDLREDAIYMHEELIADNYFKYIGDYLLNDKKHYFINEKLNSDCLSHIYED